MNKHPIGQPRKADTLLEVNLQKMAFLQPISLPASCLSFHHVYPQFPNCGHRKLMGWGSRFLPLSLFSFCQLRNSVQNGCFLHASNKKMPEKSTVYMAVCERYLLLLKVSFSQALEIFTTRHCNQGLLKLIMEALGLLSVFLNA